MLEKYLQRIDSLDGAVPVCDLATCLKNLVPLIFALMQRGDELADFMPHGDSSHRPENITQRNWWIMEEDEATDSLRCHCGTRD